MQVNAQYYKVRHLSCNLKVYEKTKDNALLYQKYVNLLKERNYNVSLFNNEKEVRPGDLYANLTQIIRGTGFKECYVEIEILKAKNNTPSTDDESIFKEYVLRKFPRHSPSAKDRCKMALKDISFRVPTCTK